MYAPPLRLSLVVHSSVTSEQAASPAPQQLQVSFHSSALLASSVKRPKAEPPPHSQRSQELPEPHFSCHFSPSW